MSYGVAPGREAASAVIWRRPAAPDPGPVRLRAMVRWVIACTLGAVFFYFDHPWLAAIAWSLSTLVFALALSSPLRGHAALERGLAVLARSIGRVLTWTLLAPFFYLVITPFGMLRRRGARDTLTRRFEPDQRSYWTRREDESDRPLEHPY